MPKSSRSRSKPKRSVLAIVTDTHGNYKFGLMNPETILWQIVPVEVDTGEVNEDGDPITKTELVEESYTPATTYSQDVLWKNFTEDLSHVEELAAGDPIDFLHLGDAMHGSKSHAVSQQHGDDVSIAKQIFAPTYLALKNIRKVRFVKGTGWHEGPESGKVNTLTALLRAETGLDVKTSFHPYLRFGDNDTRFTVDASHHGPTAGKRKWLEGNELGWYLLSYMQQELDAGRTPPRLVLRGHYHQFVMAVRNRITPKTVYESRAIICPGYSFTDAYARKSAQSPSRITIGMVAVEIVDDFYRVHPFRRVYDMRSEEVIE